LPESVTILLAALAVDIVLGEPPAWLHPVVWIGRMQQALRRRAPRNPLLAFVWGAVMAAIGPCVSGGAAWFLLAHTRGLERWILAVFLLKSAFAVRALATAGWSVSRPRAAGDLEAARAPLRGRV
jgi:adenosylcobinamide-phosphate synthase